MVYSEKYFGPVRNLNLRWLMAVLIIVSTVCFTCAKTVSPAQKENIVYQIVLSPLASAIEQFAYSELGKYLNILANTNQLFLNEKSQLSIVVGKAKTLHEVYPGLHVPELEGEEYGILRRGQNIYLIGGNDAAVLYAVYYFLSLLDCRWIAPNFDFSEGSAQFIPTKEELILNLSEDIIKKSSFKYRKLYIEEGRSHTIANLKELIDWMPKARFNTLVAPINYRGGNKVKWDNWRDQLIPELEKRGITIEVGGHGYQNFLNASMEEGQLFKLHPEWFGVDKEGNRSAKPNIVFCTSNPEAVNYLHENLLSYLKSHPEIDIFDFWPPDAETWCSCEKCNAMGSETDRHAILVSQTAEILKKELPGVKLECLAYSRYVKPPTHEHFPDNVLLDFCPIRQSFEYQIYNDKSENNRDYKESLLGWIKQFKGEISIYSYYRKYAWRSLPVMLPHYMQNDLKFYQARGISGVSVYSEPGDWFTYGLNHYVLSRLAWNPETNVDSLIHEYCVSLYGSDAELAVKIYTELEDIVRFACRIPHTGQKTPEQYNAYISRLETCSKEVRAAIAANTENDQQKKHLHRLDLMLQYATLNISFAKYSSKKIKEEADKTALAINRLMNENASAGVFIPRH